MRTPAPHQQRETKGSLINYIIFINLKLHNEYNLEILLEQIVLRKDKNKIMFNLTEIPLNPDVPSHGCPSHLTVAGGKLSVGAMTEGGYAPALTTNMGVLESALLSFTDWVASFSPPTIIFRLDFLSEEISPETEEATEL